MLIDFSLFPPNTVLFDQLPGLRFPTTPRVTTTAGGEVALSNAEPGEEFNSQSLRVDFTEAQGEVSMKAGLLRRSSAPVEAILRGFDESGVVIAQDGPKHVGPGPVEADTVFSVRVSSPGIRRVELEYSGAFSELIDDLEFDVEGEVAQPDTEPPSVAIVHPENGAVLAGESFILEANIIEDRRLGDVVVTIDGGQSIESFSASPGGQTPNFKIGPFRTGPLALGLNTITITARDLAGNEGQDAVTVNRVPLEATLVAPEGPIVLRRLIRRAVEVRLEETFPGSLDARGDIDIIVAGPSKLTGHVRIRDFLNQPEPRATLEIFPASTAVLGSAFVSLHAVEADSGRIISTADLLATIVPTNHVECLGSTVPYYRAVFPQEVKEEFERRLNEELESRPNVSALTGLSLTFGTGEIRIFRRFLVLGPIFDFPSAEINLAASIARNPDVSFSDLAFSENIEDENLLPFSYRPFRVNASPSIPVVDIQTALLWSIAKAEFERRFTNEIRLRLIRDFNQAIFERISAINELAHLFLLESRIDTREFLFGFCLPLGHLPAPVSR